MILDWSCQKNLNDPPKMVHRSTNDEEIPDRIRKDLKNECKIKATTRMYKLNEEEHFFIRKFHYLMQKFLRRL